MARLRILIASTPVGPIGSGIGGGVELTMHTLVHGLTALGHRIEVVAPEGSLQVGRFVHQISGALQPSSQVLGRDMSVSMPSGSVLAAMWAHVATIQDRCDVVLNMAYDWLPMYLTPFLQVPTAHLLSMGSLSDAMDAAIEQVADFAPDRLAAHSRAQAATFPRPDMFHVVGNGVMVDRYDFRAEADAPAHLAYVGRISPEKGFEDVAALSEITGLPVWVWGMIQDEGYWQSMLADHPNATIAYRGFLTTDQMQADLGGSLALVMTPKWVEAFGNVAVEAMATGVPVIAYERGGPAEIVIDGTNGLLVPPDDVAALVDAVGRIGGIDRAACRRSVEERHSIESFAERIERWLRVVADQRGPEGTIG